MPGTSIACVESLRGKLESDELEGVRFTEPIAFAILLLGGGGGIAFEAVVA